MYSKLSIGLTAVAAALSLSGIAQAGPIGTHSTCVYQGNTTMTSNAAGATISCQLQVTAQVDCNTRHVHITSAGAAPGDATCAGLALGNLPWGADISSSGTISGNVIETDHLGSSLPSVYVSVGGGGALGLAYGTLFGVGSTAGGSDTCAPSKPIPSVINIDGYWNGGDPTLTGGLNLLGCL